MGAQAIRTTELSQGRTSRWAVAWSFVAKGTENKPLKRSASEHTSAMPITIRELSYEIQVLTQMAIVVMGRIILC